METQQLHFANNSWTKHPATAGFAAASAQLVFMFGSRELIAQQEIFDAVKKEFP